MERHILPDTEFILKEDVWVGSKVIKKGTYGKIILEGLDWTGLWGKIGRHERLFIRHDELRKI